MSHPLRSRLQQTAAWVRQFALLHPQSQRSLKWRGRWNRRQDIVHVGLNKVSIRVARQSNLKKLTGFDDFPHIRPCTRGGTHEWCRKGGHARRRQPLTSVPAADLVIPVVRRAEIRVANFKFLNSIALRVCAKLS